MFSGSFDQSFGVNMPDPVRLDILCVPRCKEDVRWTSKEDRIGASFSAEVCQLVDAPSSQAFVYIRQLAIYLRTALKNPSQETFRLRPTFFEIRIARKSTKRLYQNTAMIQYIAKRIPFFSRRNCSTFDDLQRRCFFLHFTA